MCAPSVPACRVVSEQDMPWGGGHIKLPLTCAVLYPILQRKQADHPAPSEEETGMPTRAPHRTSTAYPRPFAPVRMTARAPVAQPARGDL